MARMVGRHGLAVGLGMVLLPSGASGQGFSSQVLSNVQTLVQRLPVGDPAVAQPTDGPKGIVRADFDSDGHVDLATANTDGSVTVHFGRGGGRFSEPVHLTTGIRSLRGIVAADLNADGRADIAVAAPFAGYIIVFFNLSSGPGDGRFASATKLGAWRGARNLEAGDFDGDGYADLVAAGPNNGLRQYRWLNGGLAEVTNVLEVNALIADPNHFPRPVYAMKAIRTPGSMKDHLVLTHADTNRVWLLSPNTDGTLAVRSSITIQANAHALDVGPLLNARSSSLLDLVTVLRDAGALEIHEGINTPDGPGFVQEIKQRIDVPGGPRAVEIVDLDGDGWNDLVVVVRNFDSVVTYANSNGNFRLASERPVGSSPRELLTGLFDDDAFPDLAVMNRDSSDLSLLMAYPNTPGYRGVNHLYLVDGNVVGLVVTNFNGDPYDDVIQLHRASGDFSVRLANPDGTLQPPVFYTVGNVPSAQALAFVNKDAIPDLITASLGVAKIETGSVTVRLCNSNGAFGVEREFQLPGVEGRLFAIVPADFDGDGNIDLAAGFLDSRVAFLRGGGDGSFSYVRTHPFVNQARGMVAGDFDKDGDFDLACVGLSGEMWVVENPGAPANLQTNLMTAVELHIQKYPAPSTNSFGGRRIIQIDENGDGWLDLIIGTGKGAWLYLGEPGLSFATPAVQLAGTDQFVSDLLPVDLDRDGNPELVVACRGRDCLSVFSRTNNGNFGLAVNLDAPASKFIATGDLDGDGQPDLVGTGRVLWTALSSSVPSGTPPLQLTDERPRLTNLVINELLAINTELPVEDDGDRFVDWVELFNSSERSLPLGGWKLHAIGPDENGVTRTNEYDFPPAAFFPVRTHLLIFFSETRRTLYHTGFRLSGDGGTLVLLDPNGLVVDRVEYPPQLPNISYARFRDASRAFAFNPFPSPLRANVFNGQLEPDLKFGGVDPATFQPEMATRFFADVSDDVGVASLTMYYQRLGQFSQNPPLQFLDDGAHGDGGVSDGFFSADLPPVLPSGSELQFYFEVVDLNDNTVYFPEEPEFSLGPGEAGNAYQLGIGFPNLPIEISELVALNQNGLIDPDTTNDSRPDWVEVRNVGFTNISLKRIALAHQLGDNSRYLFPDGTILLPGEHFVVYCDNHPEQGPLHAPFRLSSGGDTVVLSGLTTNDSRTLIDWVQFGPQQVDVALARLGAGGTWRQTSPTPYTGNLATSWLGLMETNGSEVAFTFAFPTTSNTTYTVEYTMSLTPPVPWITVRTVQGNGIEQVISQPMAGSGFFRVRRDP